MTNRRQVVSQNRLPFKQSTRELADPFDRLFWSVVCYCRCTVISDLVTHSSLLGIVGQIRILLLISSFLNFQFQIDFLGNVFQLYFVEFSKMSRIFKGTDLWMTQYSVFLYYKISLLLSKQRRAKIFLFKGLISSTFLPIALISPLLWIASSSGIFSHRVGCTLYRATGGFCQVLREICSSAWWRRWTHGWQKIDKLFRSEWFTGGRLESGKSILRRDILIIPRYSTKVKVWRCAGSRACRINRVKRRSLRTFLFLSILFRWKQIYRRVTYTIDEVTILDSWSLLRVISHFDFMIFRFNFIEVFHRGTWKVANRNPVKNMQWSCSSKHRQISTGMRPIKIQRRAHLLPGQF